MNPSLPLPSTTDDPAPHGETPAGRLVEATLAVDEARSRKDRAGVKAVLAQYPDLAERLRELLALDEMLGVDRPWSDPLGLLVGAPLSLRYDVPREPVSHGGFGWVYKARDLVLGRFVAIKVFRRELSFKSALDRFVEESQVAGQLDHPGVIPIHDLGKTPDGRPYIVMKWVEGATLHELIHRQGTREGAPRPLEAFKQVCRTVGRAHRKWGVLHRDLKPANIMIGTEGEVLVMDWGLSKVLLGADDEIEEEAPEAVETLRTLNPALATGAGIAVGTYSYMAPEQALGKNDQVKAWSDVFALGAILCEILTGRPPYWSARLQELAELAETSEDPIRYKEAIRQVVAARAEEADLDEAFARINACEADAELKRLARQCLSADPHSRPADAAAVADALDGYEVGLEAGRREQQVKEATLRAENAALKAQQDALRSRLNALRWRFLGAAALVLLLAGVVSAVAVAAVRSAARDADALQGLEEVDAALSESNRAKAEGALKGVEGRLAEGGTPSTLGRAAAARKNLKFLEDWERLRARRARVVYGEGIDGVVATWGYDAAFRDLGIDLLSGSAAGQIKASPIHEQLLGALDQWVMVEEKTYRVNVPRLLAVAQDASTTDWGRASRDPLRRRNPAALGRLAEDAPTSGPAAEMESMAWALLNANGDPEPLLRKSLEVHGDDFWLNLLTALTLEHKLRTEPAGERRQWIQQRAVEHLRIALAVQPDNAFARTFLGGLLTDCGRRDEAVEELRRSVQTVENQEKSFDARDLMNARYTLARALILRGGAEDVREAESICDSLQKPPPPRFQALQEQIRERKDKP